MGVRIRHHGRDKTRDVCDGAALGISDCHIHRMVQVELKTVRVNAKTRDRKIKITDMAINMVGKVGKTSWEGGDN